MNILNELPDIEILDRQLAQAEKLSSAISSSLPKASSTDIEGIFDNNLQQLVTLVRKRVELFQRIDQDVQSESLVQAKIVPGQVAQLDNTNQPSWFDYVFDREFEKHVKGFNSLAKRLHQLRFSQQVRLHLMQERAQPKSLLLQLETLVSRASGQRKDKLSNALFLEVNSIRNRITHTENKYREFLEQLTSKIAEFCSFVESKSVAFSSAIQEYAKALKNQEPGKYQPVKLMSATTGSATGWPKLQRNDPVGFGTMPGFTTAAQYRTSTGFGRPMGDTRTVYHQPTRGYSASNLRPVQVGAFNLSKKLYEDFYY